MRDIEDATRAIADMNGQVSDFAYATATVLTRPSGRNYTVVAFVLTIPLLLALINLLLVNM